MRSFKKSLIRSTRQQATPRATLRRSLSLQTLEDRRVLAAAVLDGGTVTVHAGDADNEIGVWANRETNKLFIKVDDTTLEFDNNLVSHVNIYAEGGNDSVAVRDSVTQTTLLDGGAGNDRIVGSLQRDTIVGGFGNDRIHGRDGNDRMDGGEGNDVVHGGSGDDGLQGGIGDDTINGGAGNDTILGDPPLPVEMADTDDESGYLPASAGSWAALTVRQNLDFAGGVYGLAGEVLEARRDELLVRSSLAGAADRPASQLSGGMRRKLGFCMAVIHEPELLVLDEPTTGVDPVSRVDLWRLVAQTASRGTAVVMSTTYLDEAERAASLTVLDHGSVLAQGTVDDVLDSLPGTITHAASAVRAGWAWRRGRSVHEFWAEGEQPQGAVLRPDLEDVVVALSLRHRAEAAS